MWFLTLDSREFAIYIYIISISCCIPIPDRHEIWLNSFCLYHCCCLNCVHLSRNFNTLPKGTTASTQYLYDLYIIYIFIYLHYLFDLYVTFCIISYTSFTCKRALLIRCAKYNILYAFTRNALFANPSRWVFYILYKLIIIVVIHTRTDCCK